MNINIFNLLTFWSYNSVAYNKYSMHGQNINDFKENVVKSEVKKKAGVGKEIEYILFTGFVIKIKYNLCRFIFTILH